MKIEIILIGIIVGVILVDFLIKRKNNKQKNSTRDITISDDSNTNVFKSNFNKILVIITTLVTLYGVYYIYLTIPKNLNSSFLNCILEDVPDNKLETSQSLNVIFFPPQYSILNNSINKDENLKIIDFKGIQKKLNSKERFNFGAISKNELKNFFNTERNSFIIPIKLIGSTNLSSYLFKNFGDGFWSSKIYLEIKNIGNFEFPKIKNVKIEGGILINKNDYSFNDDEFNLGNTFDYSNLRYRETFTSNIKKQKIEIELEEINNKSKYFISIVNLNYNDKNTSKYSENRNDFLNKIDTEEYISRTNIINYNSKIRLTRTVEHIDLYNEMLIFLTILENNRYYFKLIGKSTIDLLGPEIFTTPYLGVRSSDEISSFGIEKIYIDAKTWRGLNHPYEIEIIGNIDRLFIGGNKINIDKSKQYQKIYKVLKIDVNLGYYRIPIIAYDKFGNRTESYIDGEAVRAND